MFMKKIFIALVTIVLLTITFGSINIASAEEQSEFYTSSNSANNGDWSKKYEAELGTKYGEVSQKWGQGASNNAVACNIGQGKNNYLLLAINAPDSKEAQMDIKYVSGENRNLSFEVNEASTKKTIYNLNSGGWSTYSDHKEPILLKKGLNFIKFYLENGYAPDLDSVTFFMKNVVIEPTNDIQVQFIEDGNVLTTSELDEDERIIEDSIVPKIQSKEGKDFLGWYWGPVSNPTKYEGIFPMNIKNIPEEIFNSLDNNITFYARFGEHIKPNPIEKPGYRMIFNDEFTNDSLDTTKWVDRYLSSWSTSSQATNNWDFDGNNAIIKIDRDTEPWCPEFDGQTVVSGFTTGQRNGLHNWTGKNTVRNPEDTKLTHINQYGYYEIRAKGQEGSSRHIAWWLIGFEDKPDECVELDVFEVKGRDSHSTVPAIHKWNDNDAMPYERLQNYTDKNKDFNNEWHVYGLDWIEGGGAGIYPDRMDLYVDGKKTASINVNINYPLIQLFSLYEKRAGGWTGNWEWMPYPNTFEIDYVRVYKKLKDGQPNLPNDQLSIVNVKVEDLKINLENLKLATYKNTNYTEKNLPGTKSYVRIEWNDGIETQEPVTWDAVTHSDIKKITAGEIVNKKGYVPSVNQEVIMKISLMDKE